MAQLRTLRLRSAAFWRFCASRRRSRAAALASSRRAAASAVGPFAGTTPGLRPPLVDGGFGHSETWGSSAGGPGALSVDAASVDAASVDAASVDAVSLDAVSVASSPEASDFGAAGGFPPLPGGCGERGRFAPPGGLPGRPERLRLLAGRFFCVIA